MRLLNWCSTQILHEESKTDEKGISDGDGEYRVIGKITPRIKQIKNFGFDTLSFIN